MKNVKFFFLTEKIKRKFTFFTANTKNISSHVLKKKSVISLVLRTREITDIFNTFDEIFGIHLKKVNILYLFVKIAVKFMQTV